MVQERAIDVGYPLQEQFPHLSHVALTARVPHSASRHDWSVVLLSGKQVTRSADYEVEIVDRIGTGDAFAAGLLYGLT